MLDIFGATFETVPGSFYELGFVAMSRYVVLGIGSIGSISSVRPMSVIKQWL